MAAAKGKGRGGSRRPEEFDPSDRPSIVQSQIEEARGRGRPPDLTPELIEEFCRILRQGAYLETAAAWIGVTYRSVARWRKRGLDEIRRVEDDERGLLRVRKSERLYVDFCHASEKAIAQADVRDLLNIQRAGAVPRNWTASAWRLERRHVNQWGRPFRPEDTEDPDSEEESPILSLVDEMRKRREAS